MSKPIKGRKGVDVANGRLLEKSIEETVRFRDQMDREWLTWRQVCKQLRKLNIDLNEQDALACAIRLWGEELVALREGDPSHNEAALDEKRQAYGEHVLEDWRP